MIVTPITTRIFEEREDLFLFISRCVKKIPEQSVLAVTSKIVSLAEGRTIPLEDGRAIEKRIRAESDLAVRTKYVWLTIKDHMVMASAGIDESNANGRHILLPKDSFATARILRKRLRVHYGLKDIGVLICDSNDIPLRAGVVGIALGYAGFHGVKDHRDAPDIFGRKFTFSRTDVADSLATSAVFVMGEGNEQQPLAIIKSAPIEFCARVRRNEMHIPLEDDMYGPLFMKMRK